uniref:Uncharacterized protein n=1 Tax=Poecilia mexicana TaxID=48701 RepID=A0A3B3XNH9_9TELE
MSVTMSRTDGVTMFTLTSDPDSRWPPLCQILKSLCYSPVCCSVSQQLRTVLKTSLSVLGAIHMMIGLLNIGLGVLVHLSYVSSYLFYSFAYLPYWTGSLFIMFGIMCILSEKYPSPCLIILSVFVNIVGGALAIAAIVFYSILEGNMYVWLSCNDEPYYSYYPYRRTTPSPSPDAAYFKEKCLEGKAMMEVRQKYPTSSQIYDYSIFVVIMMSFRDDSIFEDLWMFVFKLNVFRFMTVGLFMALLTWSCSSV